MLDGLRVLDLTDPDGWLAGRILADLGAEVTRIANGDDTRLPYANAALNHGKARADTAGLARLVGQADVVLETGITERFEVLGRPDVVWCVITPFGRTGPKAGWRASDLTVQAQSGVMFMTGDPDRAPVRCSAPTSGYHGCADAVAGVLLALRERDSAGHGALVDVSLQEAHVMATMSRVGQYSPTEQRGARAGALMRQGRSIQREIWPCADGHVSFGLRGGPARIPGIRRLVAWMDEEGMATRALLEREWDAYSHTAVTQDEIDEISEPIARFFMTKTMIALFDAALQRGLMLAPANTAKEIMASRQLQARAFFTVTDDEQLGPVPVPRSFVAATSMPGGEPRAQPPRVRDLKVLEFGSGAAGPLATRYLADHGATVVRIESSTRPDFLRLYALTPTQRSLDASPMFAAFNCNKRAITLNLRQPDAREIVLDLVRWADVVAENFAPGAMARWGLSFEDLQREKPDLVMVSTCLNGQTGPERDYPGFGGQGSAISGFNHLTGWPDREPLGPFGTITDSLSPRYAAVAMLAALRHRDRTGEATSLDVSQVECAVYSLAETIVEYAATNSAPSRIGNRARADSPNGSAPHGAFRCAGDDRWIAIACHDDEDWRALAGLIGQPWTADFATREQRFADQDRLEQLLETWTSTQDRDALGARLRDTGLDAAEVLDMADLSSDPQLEHRHHFHALQHPVIGEQRYEALGFRIDGLPPVFTRPGPTLGRDNDEVYGSILGMSPERREQLAADAAFD